VTPTQSRTHPRFQRHVQVRFRPRHENKTFAGFTTNLSRAGMFIKTNFPSPIGSRLHIEVEDGRGGFSVEGAVVHAYKVSPALEKLRPSGMGVRFLPVDELVTTLLPAPPPAPDAKNRGGPFIVTFDDIEMFVAAVETDIAEGGLFVPTDRPAPLDSIVEVELRLPPPVARPVVVAARVVLLVPGGSGRPGGMGVAFREPRGVFETLRPLAEGLR
jgi:Tfp pilus assembly protein PilZ